jgi:hypothetical protein
VPAANAGPAAALLAAFFAAAVGKRCFPAELMA